jgi:DNA-directed RNA polymerase sigma subunit (sigma70/sigma32)
MTRSRSEDEDPVQIYIREVGLCRSLTSHAESELAQKMAAGGESGEIGKKDLVESQLRAVVDTARKYEGRGVHMLDLIMAGNEALMAAVESFDGKSGERLAVHAEPWIRRAIEEKLRASQDGGRTSR